MSEGGSCHIVLGGEKVGAGYVFDVVPEWTHGHSKQQTSGTPSYEPINHQTRSVQRAQAWALARVLLTHPQFQAFKPQLNALFTLSCPHMQPVNCSQSVPKAWGGLVLGPHVPCSRPSKTPTFNALCGLRTATDNHVHARQGSALPPQRTMRPACFTSDRVLRHYGVYQQVGTKYSGASAN